MQGALLCLATVLIPVNALDYPSFSARAEYWLSGKLPRQSQGPTLLFIFTRDCGNCHRSHAFLNQVEKKFGKELQIIGIHTPEFSWEKDPVRLRAYAATNHIAYPIYLDSDMEVWRALENRYWPAFYLFDGDNRHVQTFIGETHAGDANARSIESAIIALTGQK